MNEKEQLEQFVSEVETMLDCQKKYFKEPKESPQKYIILAQSRAQEKKVREMIKNYRDEQQKKLEPSLFPD
jgi:t-SNARE complex subunit (syntaxin)